METDIAIFERGKKPVGHWFLTQ